MTSTKEHSREHPAISEEIPLLSQLNNISAVSQDRCLTLEEISVWTGTKPNRLMKNLLKLIRADYVRAYTFKKRERRYCITENGISKALSALS